jgi:hypothetical protein
MTKEIPMTQDFGAVAGVDQSLVVDHSSALGPWPLIILPQEAPCS